jgi:hypothetical protein
MPREPCALHILERGRGDQKGGGSQGFLLTLENPGPSLSPYQRLQSDTIGSEVFVLGGPIEDSRWEWEQAMEGDILKDLVTNS